MSAETERQRVLLVDDDEQAGRTTASLAGSLATRLLTLHYTSGVSVVGSIIAGLAALGREAGRTVEGARIKEALEQGRGAANGEAVWSAMKIGDWAAGLPPSPILDHVRNDLALLLAEDLDKALEQPLAPPEARVRSQAPVVEEVTCVDCIPTTGARWHWGQDFRWEWGAFLSPVPGPALVFTASPTRATSGRARRSSPCSAPRDGGGSTGSRSRSRSTASSTPSRGGCRVRRRRCTRTAPARACPPGYRSGPRRETTRSKSTSPPGPWPSWSPAIRACPGTA